MSLDSQMTNFQMEMASVKKTVGSYDKACPQGLRIELLCRLGLRLKTFFMLNSAENEICSAYKKININHLNFFPAEQS